MMSKYIQIVLAILTLSIRFGIVNAQGIQLLGNKSFEDKLSTAAYPSIGLPYASGSGGTGATTVGCVGPCVRDDYFNRLAVWTSHYVKDPALCNLYTDPNGQDTYVHSPDWVGGDNIDCGGWANDFSAGLGSYEVMWQKFAGQLDYNKCYEVRIKVQFDYSFFNNSIPETKNLDIILGTENFDYQQHERQFPIGTEGACSQDCENPFRIFQVGPLEDNFTIYRFPVNPIKDMGQDPYGNYSYSNWFEYHGRIQMSSFDWNRKGISIIDHADALKNKFVQYGMDIRDFVPADGNCGSYYLQLDWIELFESCPNHYDIHGTMIAGAQEDYIASDYIKAGYVDRGPAIVTSNGRTAFKAGNYIQLDPGFLSDYGSVLEVLPNSPCLNCAPHKSLAINQPYPEVNQHNATISEDNADNHAASGITSSLGLIPNPAYDRCSVVLENGLIRSIQITNSQGQPIDFIDNINRSQYEINISGLSGGVYYVLIKTDINGTFYKKLLKL